ncbi:MFS general substrate transporter [Mollisia scopiformis]|uniref:MFS general substrate transporter n=1 Tax=Mollisia scopiformis TaxID=149040 RepID=A0A194XBF2_MOLSC|nr:MFS general substrate transporter [Mollisia scopiformis]KUJ17087.1 MFS general substrate transporter [Mollisia scopiformis]
MAFSSSEYREELVPGTEILLNTDLNSTRSGDAELVLVPEPSDQPDDPLNWSPTWKTIVIVNQAFFVFISILTPLAIAPLTPIFIEEFHKTLPQVNMLFGAAAMALGYANFIIVPFSNIFGRRPSILICGLICILANIWQARVTSYNSFIGARVIGGLGAAANESIMPMVITDVMFLHQRGLWMGLYFWAYFIGVNIGPIISGNIAAHISWRWFFWVCTIFQGVSLIMMIFMFPETRYIRALPSDHTSQTSAPATLSSTSAKNDEINITTQTTTKQEPDNHNPKRSIDHIYSTSSRPIGRPSKAQFSFIPTLHWEGSLLLFRDFLAPLQIFTFPIVFWATMSFGFATNCLLALNLTQSQLFAAPPYLFNPGKVGYVNFAFVVGGIIGLVTAGPFSDWVALWGAKRNGGVREPEVRLWALVPYIAICLVGMTVTAVGYQRHWPWEAVVVVGYGFVGIEVIAIPAIVISYAVDCYKHIPGQIMVSATIIKNTFGFGMIFYFNDWAVSAGFIPPVLTIMALAVGITLIGMVLFLAMGKRFRRATMGSKVHEL